MLDTLYLDKTLTLKINDYQNLTLGVKTILLSPLSQQGEFYIILPQGEEQVTLKYFIEVITSFSINNQESRNTILKSFNVTDADLETMIQEFGYANLLIVRVYTCFSEISLQARPWLGLQKIELTTIINYRPIFDDYNFEQRRQNPHQSLDFLTKLFPDLQFLALSDTRADYFITTLQAHQQNKPRPRPPVPDWITNQDIVNLGEWSIQEENNAQQKSAYAHGTDFEKIVRQALTYLGFILDEDKGKEGGPGGLDFYVCKPYPIVGECKSGKSIPKDTPNQLVRLGITKLGANWLTKAVKLIIASGTPTPDVIEFAQKSDTCIMNHHTLQKLVSLHAQYPNAINLIELEKYLVAGDAKEKIEQYLAQIQQAIATRAFIVKLVKTLEDKTNQKYVSLDQIQGAYVTNQMEPPLNRSELLSILIELSSPLAGYLSRSQRKQRPFEYYCYCRALDFSEPLTNPPTENTTPP